MFGYLRDLQECGDIVAIDLAGVPTAVLYDVDTIYRVLADKLVHVGMAPVFQRLSRATGSGILTNYDWTTWHPRRRRIVKPLGARSVGRFREQMAAIVAAELDSWPTGSEFDLHPAARRMTLRVVADLLFTADLDDAATAVIDTAVEEIHAWAEADPANADLANEPETFRTAIADLHAFIDGVIGGRDSSNPGDDMIGVRPRDARSRIAVGPRVRPVVRPRPAAAVQTGPKVIPELTLAGPSRVRGRQHGEELRGPDHRSLRGLVRASGAPHRPGPSGG